MSKARLVSGIALLGLVGLGFYLVSVVCKTKKELLDGESLFIQSL